MFTPVCHSVHRGGIWFWGGAWSRGGAWSGGLVLGGCLVETPPTATAAGGTHPTGMHSCLIKFVSCYCCIRGNTSDSNETV